MIGRLDCETARGTPLTDERREYRALRKKLRELAEKWNGDPSLPFEVSESLFELLDTPEAEPEPPPAAATREELIEAVGLVTDLALAEDVDEALKVTRKLRKFAARLREEDEG